jgi:hexosaminidase
MMIDTSRHYCWRNSTAVQDWMLQHGLTNVTELYSYYESKLLTLITERHKKRPLVWQEVFRQSDGNVSGNAVVDVWKGLDVDTILAATSQNRTVVVSGCWYLDYLGNDWKHFYDCKPWEFNGTSEQQSLVIGGKACMWGEGVDASVFMSRVWPRASSMAERLWTGPSCAGEESIDPRIRQFRCYLLRHGINAQPVGTGICDKEPAYRYGRGHEQYEDHLIELNPGQEAEKVR